MIGLDNFLDHLQLQNSIIQSRMGVLVSLSISSLISWVLFQPGTFQFPPATHITVPASLQEGDHQGVKENRSQSGSCVTPQRLSAEAVNHTPQLYLSMDLNSFIFPWIDALCSREAQHSRSFPKAQGGLEPDCWWRTFQARGFSAPVRAQQEAAGVLAKRCPSGSL